MIQLNENINVNANLIMTITGDFIQNLKNQYDYNIIVDTDLIIIREKNDNILLCKYPNLTFTEKIIIDDNVGGETDQITLPETDIKEIKILRFNKNIGGEE